DLPVARLEPVEYSHQGPRIVPARERLQGSFEGHLRGFAIAIGQESHLGCGVRLERYGRIQARAIITKLAKEEPMRHVARENRLSPPKADAGQPGKAEMAESEIGAPDERHERAYGTARIHPRQNV